MTNYDDNQVFELWIREKELLDRCSPRTIGSYRDAWGAFKRYGGARVASAVGEGAIAVAFVRQVLHE